MKKFIFNKPVTITVTKAIFCISCMATLFIGLIISLVLNTNNSKNIKSTYQTIAKSVNTLEDKIGDENTLLENISVLDKRTNKIINNLNQLVDHVKTLKNRTDINESDVLDVKNFIKDNDLEEFIDKMVIRQNNIETELDSLKSIQKAQQSRVDEFKKNVIEYKNQIVDKVTYLLSSSKNPDTKKKTTVIKSNFKYQLSSIEYRSGEKWAVFAPKNKITSLSDLKFLAVGDILDKWKVIKITNNSVRLNNNGQQLVLSVQ